MRFLFYSIVVIAQGLIIENCSCYNLDYNETHNIEDCQIMSNETMKAPSIENSNENYGLSSFLIGLFMFI